MKHFIFLALLMLSSALTAQTPSDYVQMYNSIAIDLDCSIPQTETTPYISTSNDSQKIGYQHTISNSLEANQNGFNAENVKVAVLDTGIAEHTDLDSPIERFDYTGDTATNPDGSLKLHFHGTHVAGIVAAVDNVTGIKGVCQCQLGDFRVLGSNGSGNSSRIAQAVRAATDKGYHIINMSLGATSESLELRDAVKYAESKGVLVVCAMGNDGTCGKPKPYNSIECGGYPARSTTLGGIAAIDSNISPASFSSVSKDVALSAAGVNILSTTLSNELVYASGTSMAAPALSGYSALLYERYKPETLEDWHELILQNTKYIESPIYIDSNGVNRKTGAGRFWFLKSTGIEEPPPVEQIPQDPKKRNNLIKTFLSIALVLGGAAVVFFLIRNKQQ